MNFIQYSDRGVVHAVMSERPATEGRDGCPTCGRGWQRTYPARVSTWCGRGAYERLVDHVDGPATCKACLRIGYVLRDAQEHEKGTG